MPSCQEYGFIEQDNDASCVIKGKTEGSFYALVLNISFNTV